MPEFNIPYEVNDPNLKSRFFKTILPAAINNLGEEAEPKWGTMTGQHMIEHLIYAFQMSTDKMHVECKTPEEKRAKLQAFLSINRPMPKGFVNPVTGKKLLDFQYQTLDRAKTQLKEEVQYYLAYYQDHPDATQTNPMFGELDAEQWQKFHFKHCFHHLSQLGLIKREKEA